MNCKMTNEFFKVVKLIQEEQKEPRDYGTGQPLFHSEVNFLDVIHTHVDTNVSELSSILGITKGAITQIARKLYDKGLIEYYMLNNNKKEKYFRLTNNGETVRKGHERYHQEANQGLCDYFCSLSDEETKTISAFLEKLSECMPFCEFACHHGTCDSERRL